ncbi:hypothetical protein EZS27_005354 [termite gut metagenome]|uniref:Uncharacterized protein n=1 Tax=termite gut metagenome TaxID=433724 RepID=A0A5J4SQ19_9ZZZZ
MKTNEILSNEQIKNLQEVGVTIADGQQISFSDVMDLILSKGYAVDIERCDEGVLAKAGHSWHISDDVTGAVHGLLCLLIKGGKINPCEIEIKS